MTIKTKQLGGVEVSKSSNAASYQIKYFVPESELSSVLPQIGSVASWAPAYATVKSYQKSWYGPDCWILSISAEEADSDLNFDSDDMDSFIAKRYTVGEMRLPLEWWGAWTASSSECPQFNSSGKLDPGERRFKNVDGNWCNPGDLVYSNAIPYEVGSDGADKTTKDSASKGAPDFTKSPFLAASCDDLSINLANQSVKTKIYNLTFYTKRLAKNINEFAGVSGEFAGSCRPSDAGAGRWKALSQTVENTRDKNGKVWTRVSRSMEQAPLGLQWDPAKNGGTWSW